MRAIINPSKISGKLNPPASKSMTQRAYAAALLHNGLTEISNAGESADELAALDISCKLGAKIESKTENLIILSSTGIATTINKIYCGESGLSARLYTPIASLSSESINITGHENLNKRPMTGIEDALNKLGVDVSVNNGCLPISVKGPIKGNSITIDASSDSQLLSGLLFALSYNNKEEITIEVTDLKSKPYIDLTIDMLKTAGKTVINHNYKSFTIAPCTNEIPGKIKFNIEGDWSSAANLLVAGAIAGDMEIMNLNINSAQADRAILAALTSANAEVKYDENIVFIKKSRLRGFVFDATDSPDLFPILAILAACCNGESYIKGVSRLFHKESNRAESVSEMLQNFDVPFSIEDDVLCIEGVRQLQGTVIDTYQDHRIVMAATVGALRANGPVDILDAECVQKSYPAFFTDLAAMGVNIQFT